jgi:hypothetical protein
MNETVPHKSIRSWRIIAEEASREFDPARMLVLIQELNEALREQGVLDAGDSRPERKTA